MKLIVTAIEDGFVRLENENGQLFDYSIEDFPPEIHEGCVIIKKNDRYEIDETSTASRKKRVFSQLNRLLEKNKENSK